MFSMNNKNESIHLAIYCSSESWGGLEKNSIELATQLKSLGYRITAFGVHNSKFMLYASKLGIETSLVKRNKRYADFLNALKLRKQFRILEITHCIFRDPRDISLISITHFLYSGFKTIYYQAMQMSGTKKTLAHRLRFSQIDAWVCTSEFLKTQVHKFTNNSISKLHVIPLFARRPESSESDNFVFASFNISMNQKRIGCVGRLDRKKDQMTLLKAFQLILNKTNWNLLFIGDKTYQEDDSYSSGLYAFVKENKMNDRVFFLPYQENISSVFKNLDLFVLPSLSETFGTVTIEAMSHGIPVIGTNSGATPEILNQNDCLFEPENHVELSEKLFEFIENESHRIKTGEYNYQRYSSNFSETIFQENWNKLLKNI